MSARVPSKPVTRVFRPLLRSKLAARRLTLGSLETIWPLT